MKTSWVVIILVLAIMGSVLVANVLYSDKVATNITQKGGYIFASLVGLIIAIIGTFMTTGKNATFPEVVIGLLIVAASMFVMAIGVTPYLN